jgi:hypothetical protein
LDARSSAGTSKNLTLSFQEESPVLHDLLFPAGVAEPDIELEADDVDVGGGLPGGAGVGAVGVAKRDVDAGEFLVLQNVADDTLDTNVGADGELPYAVGVLVSVGVSPEVALEGFVGAGDAGDAVALDVDGEGLIAEDAIAGAEEVSDDAVDDEDAVDLAGRGEALAAGKVAPLSRSMARKSARIPWVMISGVMFTMWA